MEASPAEKADLQSILPPWSRTDHFHYQAGRCNYPESIAQGDHVLIIMESTRWPMIGTNANGKTAINRCLADRANYEF
jgi:hypothetical protein